MVSGKQLFKDLGFRTVRSLDFAEWEGADVIWDLNSNEAVPPEFLGAFDLIYDGGTLEHVFNLPNALRTVHALLAVEGVVVHASPTHNFVDHGFYSFSPTLFHDYHLANGYEIIESQVFEYSPLHMRRSWRWYPYRPTEFEKVGVGGWGSKALGTWFVARKNDGSTEDRVPQQGYYSRAWQAQRIPTAGGAEMSPVTPGVISRVRIGLVSRARTSAAADYVLRLLRQPTRWLRLRRPQRRRS